MPNLLDGVLSDDANFAFCDADTFGESVVYTTAAGVATTITAVIDRNPPETGDSRVPRPKLTALIRNSATGGVTSIDSGGDTITVALRKGGTPEVLHCGAPLNSDAGCFLVPLS